MLLVRELDERLTLSFLRAEHMKDDRRGKNTQLQLSTCCDGPFCSSLLAGEPAGPLKWTEL